MEGIELYAELLCAHNLSVHRNSLRGSYEIPKGANANSYVVSASICRCARNDQCANTHSMICTYLRALVSFNDVHGAMTLLLAWSWFMPTANTSLLPRRSIESDYNSKGGVVAVKRPLSSEQLLRVDHCKCMKRSVTRHTWAVFSFLWISYTKSLCFLRVSLCLTLFSNVGSNSNISNIMRYRDTINDSVWWRHSLIHNVHNKMSDLLNLRRRR